MSDTEVILYTSHDGRVCLKIKTLENTVWLSQVEIAELFGKSRSTIAEHISAIFDDRELEADRVCRKFRQTAADGKVYEVIHYNLDLILAVGYRTRSPRGIQFRNWATTILREYLIKGFALECYEAFDEKRKQEEKQIADIEDITLLEALQERAKHLSLQDVPSPNEQ